jgi:hypothetical protein
MAEKKTKWTNADLKPQGGPATEYGPWTRTPQVDAEYDKMIDAPMSLDDIMAGAKQTLQRTKGLSEDAQGLIYAKNSADAAAGHGRAIEQAGRDRARAGANLALGTASLAGGPVMWAGSAGLGALEGVDALEAGSPGSAALAALLGAVPAGLAGVKAARGAWAGRKAAKEASKIAEGMYRQTGMSRGSEIPYRMGGSVQTPPRGPLSALVEDTPVPDSISLITPRAARQAPPGADELNDLMQMSQAPLRRETARQIAAAPARPSANYIHPADRTGAMFGFDDLPEISESELAALQQRWGRR